MASTGALLMPPLEDAERGEGGAVPREARRYVVLVVVASVVAGALLFSLVRVSPPWATIAPVVLFTAAATIAFAPVRARVLGARQSARPPEDAAGPRTRGRGALPFPAGWFAFALLFTAGVIAWGVSLYPSLPAMIPSPPGGHVAKGIGTVFGFALAGLGATAVSFALAAVLRVATRGVPGQRGARQGRGLTADDAVSLLGRIAALTAVQTAVVAALIWKAAAAEPLFTTVFALYITLLVGLVAMAMVRGRRQVPAGAAADNEARSGDGEHWKYGLFYYNRDDPAFLVPKRFGIGWTVNFGQPRGAAFFFILLGVLALAVVAGLMGGG